MSGTGNGGAITRAELAAHIRRIDEHLAAIDGRLRRIEERIVAPAHWIGGRLTAVVDRVLPLGAVAAVTFLVAHYV